MVKKSKNPMVAYFCMEYGLDTSMKIYSGGLGILAGDYVKGAKDYNYPMVAIGIKWRQGYTEQRIDENGKPYDSFKDNIYGDTLEDTEIKFKIKIRQRNVYIKVWKVVKFGVCPLYLLDTDLPENEDKWITGQLYGWFGEERIAQEMVLGIGGVRALRELGIDIDVYHFNEGHALLAGLELIREKMDKGIEFSEAVKKTKNKIVFTTHTPIIHGNEEHPIERLIYMGANNGLTIEELTSIGGSPFNMTVAALRLSRISNAVAQLHMETAKKMWEKAYGASEIIGITNAIHIPTWIDERNIKSAEGNGDLVDIHMENKRALINFVYEKNGVKIDENKIIIGFSRRATPYKRSNLIFTKTKIIEPLLKEGKIQLVFSGKAHPFDEGGKEIIEDIVKITKKYPDSVVFLENYDMTIGKILTRGSDVWLNNPRRPLEASGTSGMKAAMNGVLNCSILDGWWPESCNHGVNGWQFGDGKGVDDFKTLKELDKHDLDALYKVLIEEVIPTFYENKEKWAEMMKESIVSTKDFFSVKRMLKEYYERLYTK